MWYVSQKENMIPKSHGDRLQSIDLEMKMRERERERFQISWRPITIDLRK